jgi:circadian clock protein KaiC
MMTRLVDHLKTKGITALLTSAEGPSVVNRSSSEISSLIDTWIVLDNADVAGERNRTVSVRKSRGTAHSNQIRGFLITGRGLNLIPARRDAAGLGTTSVRGAQQPHGATNGAKKSPRRASPP